MPLTRLESRLQKDSTKEYTEEDLIRAAQQGDRDSFALLYEIHADRVHQYLVRRLGEPADAEDLTAEVFLKAMNALPSFKITGAPIIAWLLRIAHNASVNHLKKRSRHNEVELFDMGISSGDDPADVAVRKTEFDEVTAAMSGLTTLQRQVLNLRFLRQQSTAETANQMSRSEKAVKFLQHSAIRALRRRLTNREVMDDVQ